MLGVQAVRQIILFIQQCSKILKYNMVHFEYKILVQWYFINDTNGSDRMHSNSADFHEQNSEQYALVTCILVGIKNPPNLQQDIKLGLYE